MATYSMDAAPRAAGRTANRAGVQIRATRNFLLALAFMSPSLIIFILFVFWPLLKTIQLSAFLTNPIGLPVAVNFPENYQRIFTEKDLINSIQVSLMFVLYVVPAVLAFSLFLAVLANVQLKGITIFRVIFSSTIAVSAATAALIFMFLFHPAIGIFNYILDLVNLPRVQWLLSDATALPSLAIVTVWLMTGFNTIIFLAALQGIPQELYESATIDGAGFWASFRHITVPMISPTIFFLVVVSTLNTLQAFTQINVMTHGGPNNSTMVLVELIYRAFYFNGQYGIAAALSIVLFVMILLLTLIQFGVLEKRVHYG